MQLYTIGHSNHTLKEFLEILNEYGISQVIDVRTLPKSRYVPWFNQDKLKIALAKENILYKHLPALGGLRHANKNSINEGWDNLSFRGFADYMQTKNFYLALKQLNENITKKNKTTIMCAEAVPWRCHRSLIADAEVIRKVKVKHILSKTSVKEHELTSFAFIDRTKRPFLIYYPKSQRSLL